MEIKHNSVSLKGVAITLYHNGESFSIGGCCYDLSMARFSKATHRILDTLLHAMESSTEVDSAVKDDNGEAV